MKSIQSYYSRFFENDFKSTFLLLFLSGKCFGLHAFKLTANEPKYIRCRLSDTFLIISFISLNFNSLHHQLKCNWKNKIFQSLIVDYGSQMFIVLGIVLNVLAMIADCCNRNYLLEIIRAIEHFDKQVWE